MLRTTEKIKGVKTAPWTGPFKILHRTKGGAYILETLDGDLHPTNAPPNLLKLVSSGATLDSEPSYGMSGTRSRYARHRKPKKPRTSKNVTSIQVETIQPPITNDTWIKGQPENEAQYKSLFQAAITNKDIGLAPEYDPMVQLFYYSLLF